MNRFPPEIISRIARCFMCENPTEDMGSMIPLTHVCRYWRESIISTPGNWTRVSSKSKGLAALSLQRAKAAPLEICLDMRQVRESPGFSDLIGSHIQNVGTLRIDHISTIEEFTQTLPNFPQSIPSLRSLVLVSEPGYPNWDWSVEPVGLLSPALTHLSLRSIDLYPPFPHLRTLTDLSLQYNGFNLHLDILLDFFEGNRLLERADLKIRFTEPSLRNSRRRAAIMNRLQSLTVASVDAMDSNALISNIALQKGAHLTMTLYNRNAGLDDLLSVISMTHLSNLQSPTRMEYHPDRRTIRLLGPNGSLSFVARGLENPFPRLPPPCITDVQTFRLVRRPTRSQTSDIIFSPSSLPALETLVIECEVTLSHLFSTLFSNPPSSPRLKTIAFLDCDLDEDFMKELTQFAFNRKNTASAWLYRVVIINSKGILPRFACIDALGRYVPVVDVRVGKELPADLM